MNVVDESNNLKVLFVIIVSYQMKILCYVIARRRAEIAEPFCVDVTCGASNYGRPLRSVWASNREDEYDLASCMRSIYL